ncbi:unnamed protein product [Urochloa humidicola]
MLAPASDLLECLPRCLVKVGVEVVEADVLRPFASSVTSRDGAGDDPEAIVAVEEARVKGDAPKAASFLVGIVEEDVADVDVAVLQVVDGVVSCMCSFSELLLEDEVDEACVSLSTDVAGVDAPKLRSLATRASSDCVVAALELRAPTVRASSGVVVTSSGVRTPTARAPPGVDAATSEVRAPIGRAPSDVAAAFEVRLPIARAPSDVVDDAGVEVVVRLIVVEVVEV